MLVGSALVCGDRCLDAFELDEHGAIHHPRLEHHGWHAPSEEMAPELDHHRARELRVVSEFPHVMHSADVLIQYAFAMVASSLSAQRFPASSSRNNTVRKLLTRT